MSIHLQQCLIPTTDTDAAVTFYRDALGMSIVNDVSNGDCRWVTLAADGAQTQVVFNPVAGTPMSEADRDGLAQLMAKGVLGMYVFSTDDLDAAFERARAAGVTVVDEVAEQPWGVRDFALRDPSGNLVRVNQA